MRLGVLFKKITSCDVTACEKDFNWKDTAYFCEKNELADFSNDGFYPFEKAIISNLFSLQTRVMTGLNLAEAFSLLFNGERKEEFGPLFVPENIYINIKTGEIKILVNCKKDDESVNKDDDSASRNTDERAHMRIFAYLLFKLFCIDDPFDGKLTLVQYPYLSESIMAKIHSGVYGVIFMKGENSASEMIGRDAIYRWNATPAFFREIVTKALENSLDTTCEDSSIWLRTIRRLRDCLVLVKGNYRFCDPCIQNNVLFMEIGENKIPVWPQKALYWYHVGIDVNQVEKGIVAGINQEGLLVNYSSLTWSVKFREKSFFVTPKQSLKLETGMSIQINETIVVIVNGNVISNEYRNANAYNEKGVSY